MGSFETSTYSLGTYLATQLLGLLFSCLIFFAETVMDKQSSASSVFTASIFLQQGYSQP